MWLLLDIEWFVLFLQCLKVMLWIFISIYMLKFSISVKFYHLRRPGTNDKIVCVMSNSDKCSASNATTVMHNVHLLITWWQWRIKFDLNIVTIVFYNQSKCICGILSPCSANLLNLPWASTFWIVTLIVGYPDEWSDHKIIDKPNIWYEFYHGLKFCDTWYLIKQKYPHIMEDAANTSYKFDQDWKFCDIWYIVYAKRILSRRART